MDIACEFCKKSFDNKSILRHIGKSVDCKAHYGPRFQEMKRKNANARASKYRQGLSNKAWKKIFKKQIISYANNQEIREKKKQHYQEMKKKKALEKEKEKKHEESTIEESREDCDGKILYKWLNDFSNIFQHLWVKCHACKQEFDLYYILIHIGKTASLSMAQNLKN